VLRLSRRLSREEGRRRRPVSPVIAAISSSLARCRGTQNRHIDREWLI
jgi:hypothetical protein